MGSKVLDWLTYKSPTSLLGGETLQFVDCQAFARKVNAGCMAVESRVVSWVTITEIHC